MHIYSIEYTQMLKYFLKYLSAITCRRDTAMELDRRNIDVVGVCTYTYGQKCRYACRSGHFFGGDLVRTCMDNGKMDQALPTCSGK